MRPRTALAAGLLLFSTRGVPAQPLIELRGSTTEYRFADFTHTFKGAFTTGLLYLGAPAATSCIWARATRGSRLRASA